jgi:catalase
VLERRNDYVQARGRYCTMMDWERDDLVLNMGTLLGECERDVQERMVWHFCWSTTIMASAWAS